MTKKQIKTVLLLSFVFFNLFSKAQWTGSWVCPGGAPNNNTQLQMQTVGGQACVRVNVPANNCGWYFTNITGTAPICVPNNFTVTAVLQNPDNFAEFDTHLTLLDGNPNNPNFFVAQMRVDGDPQGPLQFANVGVNNVIPGCCNQQINSLLFAPIRNTWTNFTIQVNGNQVRYFLNGNAVVNNNNQVIVQTMNNPVCSIIPQLSFKGRGVVDNLTITDLNTNAVIYNETFNSLQFGPTPACPTAVVSPSFIGPDCENNNLQLFANPAGGQNYTYAWSGPNGFTSNQQNPVIPNPTTSDVGTYTLVTSLNGWNCISSTQSVNVNFEVPNCTNCSDTCYWKVTGNNIIDNNNIFGTLTKDDIRIYSSNVHRGTINAAGHFGWQTTTPSTIFDIDCDMGSMLLTSGLRLQNLPKGEGMQLVVDDKGYVFRKKELVLNPLVNNCGQLNYVTKTGQPGNLECSQIYDDGNFVGIGATTPPVLNGTPARFYVNGLAAFNSSWTISDRKYKQSIKPITNATSIINRLRGVTYHWNTSAYPEKHFDNATQAGFIAQEVKNVFPEAVATDGKENYMMNYNAFIPLLTKGQQELYEQIAALQNEVNELKQQLSYRSPDSENNNSKTSGSSILRQNRPNPFSNSTEIECFVADLRSSAFIMVCDLSGKELLRLKLNQKGSSKVQVNNQDLASGMYLYSLVVDGEVIDTKKMVLAK